MDRKVVAVFGWYGHQNIGDEAFCDSFRFLFPEYSFQFFDRIPKNIKDFDALMVGGGSFLDQPIKGLSDVRIPMAFVGVGIGGTHPDNQPALDRARIVVARNDCRYLKCPDLVFAQSAPPPGAKPDRIVVMLNNHFSPNPKSVEYQLRSWDWFCCEFAQACDRLIEQYKCPIDFVPMCTNAAVDDRRAAAHVIDRMRHKFRVLHVQNEMSRDEIMDSISHSHLVVSQRFHGLIFSVLSDKPFVAINGHSKVENLVRDLQYGGIVNYYGYSMSAFWEAISRSKDTQTFQPYVEKAKAQWIDMSVAIKAALFG